MRKESGRNAQPLTTLKILAGGGLNETSGCQSEKFTRARGGASRCRVASKTRRHFQGITLPLLRGHIQPARCLGPAVVAGLEARRGVSSGPASLGLSFSPRNMIFLPMVTSALLASAASVHRKLLEDDFGTRADAGTSRHRRAPRFVGHGHPGGRIIHAHRLLYYHSLRERHRRIHDQRRRAADDLLPPRVHPGILQIAPEGQPFGLLGGGKDIPAKAVRWRPSCAI